MPLFVACKASSLETPLGLVCFSVCFVNFDSVDVHRDCFIIWVASRVSSSLFSLRHGLKEISLKRVEESDASLILQDFELGGLDPSFEVGGQRVSTKKGSLQASVHPFKIEINSCLSVELVVSLLCELSKYGCVCIETFSSHLVLLKEVSSFLLGTSIGKVSVKGGDELRPEVFIVLIHWRLCSGNLLD